MSGGFNIQLIGEWLFVNYAKVGANGKQAVGAGEGFTDVFNTDGSFIRRFAARCRLALRRLQIQRRR